MMQYEYDPDKLMQEIEKVTGQCLTPVEVPELPKVGRMGIIYRCEDALYIYRFDKWLMLGYVDIAYKGKRPKNAFQKRKKMRNSYGRRNQRDL